MKNKQIQEFFTNVAQDESFKQEVLKLKAEMEAKKLSGEDGKQFISKVVLPKAKKLSYAFTLEDLTKFFASQESAELTSLSPEDLENVSGGFGLSALVVSLLTLLAFGWGENYLRETNFFEEVTSATRLNADENEAAEDAEDSENKVVEEQREENAEGREQLTVSEYFSEPRFSDGYKGAVDEVKRAVGSINKERNLSGYVNAVSSNRSESEDKSKLTPVEKKLDAMVARGDLPIKAFTVNDLSQAIEPETTDYTNVAPTYVYKIGQDALTLGSNSSPNAIIQVASQANALESVRSTFSPVINWPYDWTQGPRASLDALTAAKHREAAHLQNKLPDAFQYMIAQCMVSKDGSTEKVIITEKYADLYQGGYLQPWKVTEQNDLETLKQWIHDHIGELKVNAQWVQCESNGQNKLQVFNFAPSFQGHAVNWNSTDETTNLYKSICNDIVCAQYRSLGTIAKLRYKQTRDRQEVHLTQVGQGAFNNPPETLTKALEAFNEAVQGVDVKVVLHQFSEKDRNGNKVRTWQDVASDNSIRI